MYLRSSGGWETLPLQNNATTTATNYALDARMGKTLNDKISVIGWVSSVNTFITKSYLAASWWNVLNLTLPSAGIYVLFGKVLIAEGNKGASFQIGFNGNSEMFQNGYVPDEKNNAVSVSDVVTFYNAKTIYLTIFPHTSISIANACFTVLRVG